MTWLIGLAWRPILFGAKWKLWLWAVAGALVLVKTYGISQQRKGVEKERVRVETKAKEDVKKATAARERSQSGSGGVRDKYARD